MLRGKRNNLYPFVIRVIFMHFCCSQFLARLVVRFTVLQTVFLLQLLVALKFNCLRFHQANEERLPCYRWIYLLSRMCMCVG